ncbi:hypothetical protein [Chryseobacterium sp. 5_R23647]|uniref:hypothetical protein n=1 Tax=Chryseobacterium sp. 5_R23647 TaxID=2258964 RepID=UPI000E25BA03|nr:hypothetical protein [Chryseobacterium sp. 5_R23647]REC40502.1 hypothetical protein DRF69_18585 [Chryseobacterium sp. 5_R23647]
MKMNNNRKSNRKFPFEGSNPYAIWSVNDSMEQLQEIKSILQEKTKRKWLIFYSTTVVMILISFLIYYNVKGLIVFIISIFVFVYILYIQLTRLKRFKILKIDLNSRIEQLEKRKENQVKEIVKILENS